MIKEHPLTTDQLKKVLKAAKLESRRDFCLLSIAANHAIRVTELARLRTADINLKDRTIYIRRLKGSNSTTEQLFDWEIAAISSWLDDKPAHELLFPSPQGGELCRMQLYRVFRYYSEIANNPAASRSPHAFRHTIGQSLADGGVDIKRLQGIMGHKNINSTAQYYSVSQRECDETKKRIFAKLQKEAA